MLSPNRKDSSYFISVICTDFLWPSPYSLCAISGTIPLSSQWTRALFQCFTKKCGKEASFRVLENRRVASGSGNRESCEVVFWSQNTMDRCLVGGKKDVWVDSAGRSQYSVCSSGANLGPRRVAPVCHRPQSSFLQAWNCHIYPSRLSQFLSLGPQLAYHPPPTVFSLTHPSLP